LPRGGHEQIGAADHLVDPEVGIVDDDGELVGVDTISASEDKIANTVGEVLLDRAVDTVVHRDWLGSHANPLAAWGLVGRETVTATAGVDWPFWSGAAFR